MTSDAIADSVVATFNAIPEGEKRIQFQAENPPFVPEYTKETITGVKVHAYAIEESEEAFNQGDDCKETRVVNCVVCVPLKGETTKALALELVEQLRHSLRETEFSRHKWDNNQTTTLYDNETLKAKQTLISQFRATYTYFG